MLTTNLLPLEEKKLIQREATRRIVQFLGAAVILAFGIGIILLMPSYIPLAFEKKELELEFLFEEEASNKLNITETLARIRKTRSNIETIRTSSLAPVKASDVLNQFFDGMNGVELRAVTLQREGGIVISGYAYTRNNLLDFEKKLRDSGRFQQIVSPLSNIVRDADILFTIQGALKPYYQPY